ncbi:hypothetical protein V2J09_021463 [Rumex salicifolius]
MERHPRRLHMLLRQLQVLLELLDNRPPASMDTEMLKCELEVRDVRLDLGIEQLLANEGDQKQQLLAHREDEWAQRRDASPATAIRSLERETPVLPSVLFLVHALERVVVGPVVRAYHVHELVRLERSTAAPPIRKRQLVTSIGFRLPVYPFRLRISVLITNA